MNAGLMVVIAQQIVEKKGQDHDFARTGYVHFFLSLFSSVRRPSQSYNYNIVSQDQAGKCLSYYHNPLI